MATTKSAAGKTTMDVSLPGVRAPDSSARPVIVTHKPLVQDPMVQTGTMPKEDTPVPEQVTAVHNKIIQPLSAESDADSSTDKQAAAGESEKTAQSSEAAIVDAVADQADSKQKKAKQTSQEEIKKQAEIQDLLAQKTYFVPIGKVAERRSQRRVLAVMLVLLAAIVLVYAAIDAGMLEIGVNLPFDLIKN